MLVSAKEILLKAQRRRYAIGAFNTFNLETTQAIIRGLEAAKSPGILQVSPKTLSLTGSALISLIHNLIEEAKVPLSFNLDHGKDLVIIKKALALKFPAVMIDASELPLRANIAETLKAKDLVKKQGVWIEGELGSMLGKEGLVRMKGKLRRKDFLTDPLDAQVFVQSTKIDALAVSLGTLHGSFKGREKIDYQRLKEIRKRVKIPLVLHGGSGLRGEAIRKAIKLGIVKVNIDTDLRISFIKAAREVLRKQKKFLDPREIMQNVKEKIQKTVEEKIAILGSRNKA